MHPVSYSATHFPEDRRRLTALFRFILVIPWAIVAAFYGLAAAVLAFLAWFALVFTKRYPEGLYRFNAGFLRFYGRLIGWIHLFNDQWPPSDGQEHADYPVRTEVTAPKPEYSRIEAQAFWLLLTEEYPPFWVDEEEELAAIGAGAGGPPPVLAGR